MPNLHVTAVKLEAWHARIRSEGKERRLTPESVSPMNRMSTHYFLCLPLTFLSHVSDHVLSGLLERLLRVEEKCTRLVADPSTVNTALSNNSPGSLQGSYSQTPGQTPEAHFVVSSAASRASIDNDAEETEASDLPSCLATPLNADVRLQQAFEQVLHLKRQNLFNQTVPVDYHIQPEIAKACIESKHWIDSVRELFKH